MVKKGLFLVIILGLVLVSLSFVSAAGGAVINSITINDTDNFYSNYTGNNIVHIIVNASGVQTSGYVLANFSGILPTMDCGSGIGNQIALSNVTYLGNIYNGNCDVGDEATLSNFNLVGPIAVFAKSTSGPNPDAVNLSATDVVLYNMTTPPAPPAQSCTQFGPLMTNFVTVPDFAHVNFVVNIQANFSCLAPPQAHVTASEFRDVMILNLYSVDLSTQGKAQKLQLLQSAMNVTLVAPHKNGNARIYINETAFAELNTTATIKFFYLPFTRQPAVIPDISNELGGISTVLNGYDSDLKIATVNMTINVTGFSGDTITDNETPIITINSFANSTTAITSFNVTVNATGGEPSNITIVLDSVLYTYLDGGINSAGCTNISADKEIFNCYNGTITSLTDGSHTLSVTAYDHSGANGGLGNTNTTSKTITVDSTAPTITVLSPLNNSVFYANTTIPIHFTASDLGTGIKAQVYTLNETFNVTYTQVTNITHKISGRFNITFYATDYLGNAVFLTGYWYNVTLAPANSIIAENSSMTIGANVNGLIVNSNSPLQTVTIPSTSTQEVYLDVLGLKSGGSATVPNNFTLTRDSGTANYTLYIPAGTTATGASSWDGKIYLPIVNSTTFTAPGNGTSNVVIDAGSTGELNFSSAVRITLGGMADKAAAWTRGSATLTDIATKCNSVTAPANIDASVTRECYINSADGKDLVIWTYHLTEFAAYTPGTTTTAESPSSSGGGGGGTQEWIATYTVTDAARLAEGYVRALGAKERIKFNLGNDTHYVGVVSITNNSATIRVSSTSQDATLAVGDTKKFDVTGDNVYDIKVTLNQITGNKAQLTVQTISESIPAATSGANQAAGAGGNAIQQIAEVIKKSTTAKIIFWIVVILIIAVIVWLVMKFAKKR